MDSLLVSSMARQCVSVLLPQHYGLGRIDVTRGLAQEGSNLFLPKPMDDDLGSCSDDDSD